MAETRVMERPWLTAVGLRGRLAIFPESGRLALAALLANRLRSTLTLLGIVIGVATVVAMASVLSGLDAYMAKSVASLGSGSIFLTKYEASVRVGGGPRRETRENLTLEDAEAVARDCPSVLAVCPSGQAMLRVYWQGERTKHLPIEGGNEDYLLVNDRTMGPGRFFTRDEVHARTRVCVIGADVQETLFEGRDPLGERVRIGSHGYRVIGVLAEKGSLLGNNQDELVAVPITALQQDRGWGRDLDHIMIQPRTPRLTVKALDEVESLMRRRRGLQPHEDNNFGLTTQENLMELYENMTRAIYGVMLLVSGIALAVGGIGIMNMMLVSVKERTREIGIRRAVGARRTDVMLQFLAEAMTLTILGGCLGILLGASLALVISMVTPLPVALPLLVVLLALGLACGVGLFFGIYPAYRASVQDPIDALRYE